MQNKKPSKMFKYRSKYYILERYFLRWTWTKIQHFINIILFIQLMTTIQLAQFIRLMELINLTNGISARI